MYELIHNRSILNVNKYLIMITIKQFDIPKKNRRDKTIINNM